jgi:hypothetical protein
MDHVGRNPHPAGVIDLAITDLVRCLSHGGDNNRASVAYKSRSSGGRTSLGHLVGYRNVDFLLNGERPKL